MLVHLQKSLIEQIPPCYGNRRCTHQPSFSTEGSACHSRQIIYRVGKKSPKLQLRYRGCKSRRAWQREYYRTGFCKYCCQRCTSYKTEAYSLWTEHLDKSLLLRHYTHLISIVFVNHYQWRLILCELRHLYCEPQHLSALPHQCAPRAISAPSRQTECLFKSVAAPIPTEEICSSHA